MRQPAIKHANELPRPSLAEAYGTIPTVDALCEERRMVIVIVARLACNNPVPWETMDPAFRRLVVRAATYAVRVAQAANRSTTATH